MGVRPRPGLAGRDQRDEALVAVGLTLTFGVMRMVNFAEGQSVMIGAFVAYTTVPYLGYVGGIAAAMAVNAVLGIILERTAFRPFRGIELNGLIASMSQTPTFNPNGSVTFPSPPTITSTEDEPAARWSARSALRW